MSAQPLHLLDKSVLLAQWGELQRMISRLDHVASMSRDARFVAHVGNHQMDVDFAGVMLNRELAANVLKGAWRDRLVNLSHALRGFLENAHNVKPEDFDAARLKMPERGQAEVAIFGDDL
ncbi:hypothetical protein [Hyphococcus sp.]|uniref:hypothetical protein n=1 Tax=Hyphococcus sp. TaxID=2038636 RepID=UPI00208CA450|nr:MAG: hypothetical protein DHS20C04_32220 [Marinicaulis sp.]